MNVSVKQIMKLDLYDKVSYNCATPLCNSIFYTYFKAIRMILMAVCQIDKSQYIY